MPRMKQVHEKHLIYRTSGEKKEFRGTCVLCGAIDMTFDEGKELCPNPKQLTSFEAYSLASETLHSIRMEI